MYIYKISSASLDRWLHYDDKAEQNHLELSSIVNAALVLKSNNIDLSFDSCWLEAWTLPVPFSDKSIVVLRDNPHGEGYAVSPTPLIGTCIKPEDLELISGIL